MHAVAPVPIKVWHVEDNCISQTFWCNRIIWSTTLAYEIRTRPNESLACGRWLHQRPLGFPENELWRMCTCLLACTNHKTSCNQDRPWFWTGGGGLQECFEDSAPQLITLLQWTIPCPEQYLHYIYPKNLNEKNCHFQFKFAFHLSTFFIWGSGSHSSKLPKFFLRKLIFLFQTFLFGLFLFFSVPFLYNFVWLGTCWTMNIIWMQPKDFMFQQICY